MFNQLGKLTWVCSPGNHGQILLVEHRKTKHVLEELHLWTDACFAISCTGLEHPQEWPVATLRMMSWYCPNKGTTVGGIEGKQKDAQHIYFKTYVNCSVAEGFGEELKGPQMLEVQKECH